MLERKRNISSGRKDAACKFLKFYFYAQACSANRSCNCHSNQIQKVVRSTKNKAAKPQYTGGQGSKHRE